MFPPVTGTRHSFQITPHRTCSAVWVRMRAWRRSQSMLPCTWSPTAGSGPLPDGVPDGVALLAHVDHGQAGEHAGVVGLAAAGGVEGRAIERDPAAVDVDLDDVGVERRR